MDVWGITHRGVVRQQNQDAFATRKLEDGRIIAVVCDGMGGARAGNVASTMAVELFMDQFAREPGENDQERLQAAAALANREVFQRSSSDQDCAGMGTTLQNFFGSFNDQALSHFLSTGDLSLLFSGLTDSSGATLTVALYVYAKERAEFDLAFSVALVLLAITLAINLSAKLVGKRLKKR